MAEVITVRALLAAQRIRDGGIKAFYAYW